MRKIDHYYSELNRLNSELQIMRQLDKTPSVNNKIKEIVKLMERHLGVIWFSTTINTGPSGSEKEAIDDRNSQEMGQ